MSKQDVEVRVSKTGQGVFAKVKIPARTPILEFTGSIVPKNKTELDPATYLQVGGNRVMGPSGSIDDYINHSCDPNCFVHIVGNRAILYSLYIITPNTELTFDYSTSSTDTHEEWKMDCMCGSYRCRKTISGYQYLPESIKTDYEAKGMIPIFIRLPNLIQKD